VDLKGLKMQNSAAWSKEFEEIWDKGQYRLGSTSQRLVPFLKQHIPAGMEVNDYGSGTGRAELGLIGHCAKINMVDFADNALEERTRKQIGENLTYTVSPLEKLPNNFPVADWGICINVLMLVDPEKLDAIQWEMRRTCRNIIVEVYDWPDERLGKDRTTIKMNMDGWAAEMAKYWPIVETHKSPEHPRRYILIGRSGE